MKIIRDKLFEYLKLKIPSFATTGITVLKHFTCPYCKVKPPSASFKLVVDPKAYCNVCNKFGDIYDYVRELEVDKREWTNDQISNYISNLFNLGIITGEDIQRAFEYYKKYNFNMVPIQKDGKRPIEKDWTNKDHTEIGEWETWLKDGLNVGLKTGLKSQVIGLDIDTNKIPSELAGILIKYDTLIQKSGKGFHYFFGNDPEIPNGNFNFKGVHIDVRSDGGQIVMFPSVVDGVPRKILNMAPIAPLPSDLKEFLKKYLSSKPVDNAEIIIPDNLETLKLINNNLEGCCNNTFIKLGGILRKELSLPETSFVLNVLNKQLLENPMDQNQVNAMIGQLGKYIKFDHTDIANRVVDYLRVVKEASPRDVKEVIGESKELVDKTLAYLVKEERIIKRHRFFKILEKAEWKETFFNSGEEVQYTFPYFHDRAVIRDGDLIVIGGLPGQGKSHVAMNIIKRLKMEGIKPYYVSLESGNRFSKIATTLGLIEGDFYWDIHYSPESIEIERNAVTIIDWLLPKNYAETDKTFEYFSQQLVKNRGILIIFVQLRNNGDFFAADQIEFFPAFAFKFMYDQPDDRTKSKFIPIKLRESRNAQSYMALPTVYDWKSKELKRIDELEEHK